MEVLTQLFQAKVRESNQFKFHPQCENLKITHLSFADDLVIFVAADLHSVQLVKDTLDEFKELSGLLVNHSKSEVFVQQSLLFCKIRFSLFFSLELGSF